VRRSFLCEVPNSCSHLCFSLSGGEFCAKINVEANPPNGEICQDEDEYKFTIPVPPTPEPCNITLASECTIAGGEFDGQDCEAPLLGYTVCLERPTGATMLFNGGTCEQSDNTQELKFTCMDMNGGPPVNEGDQAYIVVTDIKVGLAETFAVFLCNCLQLDQCSCLALSKPL